MRAVLVSKALVVGAYQRKAEEIASQGVELTVLVPPAWRDKRGSQALEHAHVSGYTLKSIPLRFNGHFHFHYYPTLGQELARLRPHILHMDEEPYNLATWLALTAAARLKIPSLFFSWQNLLRRYPPPFRWMEQANYRHAAAAIAGNLEAAQVLRSKGFAREILVLPQFGVDPHAFSPAHGPQETPDNSTDDPTGDPTAGCLQIGYAGGLLPEKGLELLLDACAALQGEWRLVLAGEGTVRALLHKQAARLGIETRVVFAGRIPSGQMPAFLRTLDVLVLPSRTTPSWKEQFGRVLIEAMASGVAVVGSDSGEIPHVIGDAGLVFAEGDVDALRAHLQFLMDTPAQRIRLAKAGRARVVDRFTMRHVAVQTVALYQRVATAT